MPTNQLAAFGSLLADNTRAEMLCALMDGRAHTGGELARQVGVSASTASEHLSKLQDAGVVSVEPQGRHRYFRLASPEVAELLETLNATRSPVTMPLPKAPAALLYARTCYDHLAGELAVRIHDRLIGDGHLAVDDENRSLTLTASGADLLERIGVDVEAARRAKRPTVRPCLDWTQRRHHLAGSAAAGLLEAMLDRGWMRRGATPRSIQLTDLGRAELGQELGLDVGAVSLAVT